MHRSWPINRLLVRRQRWQLNNKSAILKGNLFIIHMFVKKGNIQWIHAVNPSEKEIIALKKEFSFHPIILQELKTASARSKVEFYDDYLFIVYHLPLYDEDEKVSRKGEIDFLITKKQVITIAYDEIEPLADMEERLERNRDYHDRLLGGDTARLFYYLMEACLLFSLRQLRHVDEKVEYIRNNLFKQKEEKILKYISYVKRDLLSYYLITKPQLGIFNSLDKIGTDFFGDNTRIYFSDLEGDFLKITQLCENYKETIEAFESTNTQLMTTRMTKVMQRFSVLAFLTFPMMVFLALFAIESSSRPIIGKTPYDFWIIAGIVVVVVGLMSVIFRKKGWL